MPNSPSYLKNRASYTKTNVFGEDIGYCMCRDRIRRGLSINQILNEVDQLQIRCGKEVARKWNTLSRIENPPNPLGHPQRRALNFQDVIYIPPELVGEPLEQVTFDLGMTTGYCACDRRNDVTKRKLSNREWSAKGNSFFEDCRNDIVVEWTSSAAHGEDVPQGLPAPTRTIWLGPGSGPDLSWIPHPHGLGATLSRLRFKGLAAAASKVRQEVWDFGKEEGLLLRGLER
ncbi:MAG: hypothetical protein M1826_001805 [Phylliscum demangeonii]|nr:MAG: hypothetical protein M1826_001805 [Phylliscum demangeonii]